jgi:putative ABC transport system permease protein
MLEVFGTVLDAITFAVAAIGGISLLVGGVGILTILTIAVAERTSEIGLLRARRDAARCWRSSSAKQCCSRRSAAARLAFGWGAAAALKLVVPALPLHAVAVCGARGNDGGRRGARRRCCRQARARLDPMRSLRSE